jgi:hypothetical protein
MGMADALSFLREQFEDFTQVLVLPLRIPHMAEGDGEQDANMRVVQIVIDHLAPALTLYQAQLAENP